jgi:hypothetical protein
MVNSSFKFRHPTLIHEKFLKFLPSKDCEILICESNYPIYLLQSDEEMINFFIIEVEENFSMESIDSIFHVYHYRYRRWEKKAPSLMIFGSPSSTKPNRTSMNPVSATPNYSRLITEVAWVPSSAKATRSEPK